MTTESKAWMDRAITYALAEKSGSVDGPIHPQPAGWVADFVGWDASAWLLEQHAGPMPEEVATLREWAEIGLRKERQQWLREVRASLGRLVAAGVAHEMCGENRGRECRAWILKAYDC